MCVWRIRLCSKGHIIVMRRIIFLAAMLATMVGSAQAATVLISKSEFDSRTTTTVETFESTTNGLNDFKATTTLPWFSFKETRGFNAIGVSDRWDGVFATSGSNFAVYYDNGASIGHIFGFASPITALGFNITSKSDTTFTVSTDGHESKSYELAANVPFFLGLVNLGGITSLGIDVEGVGLIGLDDIAFGSVSEVPLPAAAPLMVMALAGFAANGARRRNAKATA